jgi:AcrR family transcriptional regulator
VSVRPDRPRRGTPDGTRERLVAAAADVLNRDGYYGTDSNAIARAAGYSPATFYKHFVDKRAILLAAYERWVTTEWDHIGTVLRTGAAAATAAPRARRRRGDATRTATQLTAWIVAHHRRWRGLRASVLALAGTDAAVRQCYVAQRRRQLELLGEMRRRRARPPGDREADALLLFAFERTCDALAGDEARALALRPAHIEALLVRALATHLAAGRSPPARPPAPPLTTSPGSSTTRRRPRSRRRGSARTR